VGRDPGQLAAYRERVAGNRSENLEQSLACLDAALSALGGDPDAIRLGAHQAYVKASERLRTHESEQRHAFQPL
jgi:hypothetical protein